MVRKIWSIVAFVVIFAITVGVSQFIPQELNYCFCLFGGFSAIAVQQVIANW